MAGAFVEALQRAAVLGDLLADRGELVDPEGVHPVGQSGEERPDLRLLDVEPAGERLGELVS